ncbi:hypothetical protein [Actinoplanes sp. NPDC051851]|uniref:hypothetical protein n=1 Tax=Actinoplanes sp. NPDC051851 TaxID=3154753 RepID=UPI0034428433
MTRIERRRMVEYTAAMCGEALAGLTYLGRRDEFCGRVILSNAGGASRTERRRPVAQRSI